MKNDGHKIFIPQPISPNGSYVLLLYDRDFRRDCLYGAAKVTRLLTVISEEMEGCKATDNNYEMVLAFSSLSP